MSKIYDQYLAGIVNEGLIQERIDLEGAGIVASSAGLGALLGAGLGIASGYTLKHISDDEYDDDNLPLEKLAGGGAIAGAAIGGLAGYGLHHLTLNAAMHFHEKQIEHYTKIAEKARLAGDHATASTIEKEIARHKAQLKHYRNIKAETRKEANIRLGKKYI